MLLGGVSVVIFGCRSERRGGEGKEYALCAVGGVAHQAVENSPRRAKDPWGRTEGGLFEGEVGFLRLFR